ncbi:mitochondrial carrier domain-containing protein [Podospora appendiculata]|uniref:Mitochondrial carrier domain-containing protein n=1 Tax=Podospora appendiculata TaxID=314037 RepID=A0AAE0XGJ2_9PEZI|nr:mitochondrial carrier domain-containing protein [Podospora appendiculata]
MPRASKLLPSIGHAASGAGGTIISTLATYPLDLVNTRLKVQRQLHADGTIGPADGYRGIADAFATIYAAEGGLAAFFSGLGADLGKSAADSFLFFLFYTWFRARRLRARDVPYLNALEELAVGAAAGACAKLFTTPASNVVTRRQTASLLQPRGGADANTSKDSISISRKRRDDPSFGELIADIRRERGVLGLWAGYSASLVLTLNPSTTFFLQQMLKRGLVPRERWDAPGAAVTFFLAAVSKCAATALTYPFQIAKARVQVSASPSPSREEEGDLQPGRGSGGRNALTRGVRGVARDTIFATVVRIARAQGVKALYDGIGGELLKAFFNHGTTMLSKDIIHGLLVRLYFVIVAALKGFPRLKARLVARQQAVADELRGSYLRVLLNMTESRWEGGQETEGIGIYRRSLSR